jgi:sugar/nucleoside kinase (ribokinase family)
MPTDPFSPPPSDAVAVGTGRLTLDVIVRDGDAEPARSQAGGTCGNVLADLACLGWRVYPLTDLGDDDPGDRFCADLQRWGARLDLIRRNQGEQTPVIIHHVRETPQGPVHSFSSRCPFCGYRLRYYEPVPTAGVLERLPRVPAARAFFFDRDSEGSLLLARHCREQGALVVYEPNYAGKEVQLNEALAVAHVLKFSRDRLPDMAARPLPGPALIVETMGGEGLRYLDRRHGGAEWRTMPALAVTAVRDAGGSGDWTTAGFIHLAGRGGSAGFLSLSGDEVREALRFGQALAAWNCAFVGARGGVYHAETERWQADGRRILAGQAFDPLEGCHASTHDGAGRFCPACGGLPRS